MNTDLSSYNLANVMFIKFSYPAEAWEVNLIHHDIHGEQDCVMETHIGTNAVTPIYGQRRIVGGITFTCKHKQRGLTLIEALQNRQIDILEIVTGKICQRYKKIHPVDLKIEPGDIFSLELRAEEVEYLEAKDQTKIDIKTPHIKPLGKLSPSKSQGLIHNHATDALKYALNPDDPGLDIPAHGAPPTHGDIAALSKKPPQAEKPKKKKRRGRRILP